MLIGPFFIDWTAYRADFEREASRILGHPVKVHGSASARLLPFPTVTFGNVVVEGETPERPLMSVAEFRMDAELAPYLSGEIRIHSMTLDRPQMLATIGRDGALAWIGKDSALSGGGAVVLESVDVVGGRLTVENALTGRTHDIDDINAKLSARSLSGPFSGEGAFDRAGERIGFTLSSGQVQPDGKLPLKFSVQSPRLNASLSFDGSASSHDRLPQLAGALRLVSPLPREALAPPPPQPVPQSASASKTSKPGRRDASAEPPTLPPFTLTAAVTADPRAIQASDIRLATGGGEKPYRLTGSGSLDLAKLAHFSLTLTGEQIDVDAIAAGGSAGAAGASPAAKAGDGKDGSRPSATFEARLAAARRIFAAIPRPSIPGTASLSLPVVVAGDTTIRDVAFSVSPTDTGWSVQKFTAELPGRTTMEATGVVGLESGISYDGDLLVASRQPSGFSDWLTGAVDPAIVTLGQAGFSAKVDLSADHQRLDHLEINIGGDTLKGRLERSGPRGQRYTDVDLSGGKVDLDAFLALSRLFTGENDSLAETNFLSLKIAAGPVVAQGIAAGRINADVAYNGKVLRLDRLNLADFRGADVAMEGEISDPMSEPAGRLDLAIDAANPKPLVDFLSAILPASPALAAVQARADTLGPLSIKGTARTLEEKPGERPTLHASFDGTAAGTSVHSALTLGNGIYAGGTSGRFGLDLTLSNAKPSVLLSQVGIEAVAADTPQPLTMQLSLSAGASGPVVASAAMRAPGSEITAEGNLDVATTGFTGADFGLAIKSRDLAPWLRAVGADAGAGFDAALPVDLSGTLTATGEDLSLSDFAGQIGAVDLSAELAKSPGGPVTGQAYVSQLSLPFLSKLVYGRALVPDAKSLWPDGAFSDPLLPPLEVSVDLSSDALDLGAGAVLSDVSAHVASSQTALRFTDLQGGLSGGHLSGSASVQNANGVGGFSLKADLSAIDLGEISLGLADNPDADAPVAGALDAKISLDGTGQSYAALVASLTGAGSISVDDGNFAGIRRGLFRPLLLGADAPGFTPSADSVTALLGRMTAGGHYPVPSLQSEFSVKGGLARFAPAVVPGPGEALTLSGAIDLKDAGVKAQAQLALDPGEERVEGAEPSIRYAIEGRLTAPLMTPDVEALTSFLSVRAYEIAQARIEAMQAQLQERLRLRREVRYHRWREEEGRAAEAVSATREGLALRRQTEAEAARDAEARRAEEARKRAMEAPGTVVPPSPRPNLFDPAAVPHGRDAPPLVLDDPSILKPQAPATPGLFRSLPNFTPGHAP